MPRKTRRRRRRKKKKKKQEEEEEEEEEEEGGEGGGERGRTRRITATAAVTIRHDRNATYEPPSDAEIAAIRRRNALDIELYEAALQIHAAQLKRSGLCEYSVRF